jgi:hypothetical protein
MKVNSMSRILLAVVLSISLIATGCSAQWVSVALADLPVLTQMSLNLAALVATLQSGKQLTPAEALAIQNISAEASKEKAKWEEERAALLENRRCYFLRQRTPSLVISTRRPAEVSSARMASEA